MTIFLTGDFTIVNKYVGSISVAKSINAEKRAWYNLTIMAKDEGDLSGGVALNSTVSGSILFQKSFNIVLTHGESKLKPQKFLAV